MGETVCYACDTIATAACQSCGQPSCDQHLKTVFGFGSELTQAGLFGFPRARSKGEIEKSVCSNCHTKLRRKNVRLLLCIPLLLLLGFIAVVAVALILRQVMPP